MIALNNFFIAFVFSFIGFIPPGTINLTVIQLGLEKKIRMAFRFSVAAALIEYPYAWIAVRFETVITSTPIILENIQLVGAVVMTAIGIANLLPVSKANSSRKLKFYGGGFRKGLFLGLLNPLNIPYWIAITAYLRGHQWIDTTSVYLLQAYLLGSVIGSFVVLILLSYLGNKFVSLFSIHPWAYKVPGLTLICLGLYSFVLYLT